MKSAVAPGQVRHQLLQWINLRKLAFSSLLPTPQQRYERDFDKSPRQEARLKEENHVLLGSPQLGAFALNAAHEMVSCR